MPTYTAVFEIDFNTNLTKFKMTEVLFDPFQCEIQDIPEEVAILDEDTKNCTHENIIEDFQGKVCQDCGETLTTFVEEIESYGQACLTRGYASRSRTRIRRVKNEGIHRFIVEFNFSQKVIDKANDLYMSVCSGETRKGPYGKSIVCACIFYSLKFYGIPMDESSMFKKFGLKKDVGLKGIKTVDRDAPINAFFRNLRLTPDDLINIYMKKLSIDSEDISKLCELYKKIEKLCKDFKSSKPQSVAAGMVYWWLLNHSKSLVVPIDDYKKLVGLSKMTIEKMTSTVGKVVEKRRRSKEHKRSLRKR